MVMKNKEGYDDISVKDNLQKLGKICVTCQVNQSVNDANENNLEGVQ